MQESSVYRALQRETKEVRDREIAINLLREGLPVDVIARGTGLSIEEVQHLQQQMNDAPQN
jgi:DNA-binding NarL/FixJ family response regulator